MGHEDCNTGCLQLDLQNRWGHLRPTSKYFSPQGFQEVYIKTKVKHETCLLWGLWLTVKTGSTCAHRCSAAVTWRQVSANN